MNLREGRLLPLALNAAGIAVVAYGFSTSGFSSGQRGWLTTATALALLAWGVTEALQRRFWPGMRDHVALHVVRRTALLVGVMVASFSQAPSDALHTAPLAVMLVMGISSEDEPRWFGWVLAALAFVLTPIGAAVSHSSTQALLGYLAANAVWVLVGVSRRQGRAAAKRNAELVEQQQAAREREARVSALELREAVARDIHDVLAHSLGGLVIQLDAAEALLESGRDDEARVKVGQARRLAAEGLEDARRAVATLRSPEEAGAAEQTANDLAGAAQRLLRAHRELGGTVDADVELRAIPGPLPASVAEAFERALQEALSNARRHAPGEPVAVELAGSRDELELTVSNALAGAERSSDVGGGHGLRGMAERFAALPGGSASARAIEGRFVVTARASLDEPPAGAAVAGPAPRTAGAR